MELTQGDEKFKAVIEKAAKLAYIAGFNCADDTGEGSAEEMADDYANTLHQDKDSS